LLKHWHAGICFGNQGVVREHENNIAFGHPVVRRQHLKFGNMKKLFTLALGLLLTVAMFAADRRPSVTVSTSARGSYEIVIDGRSYYSSSGQPVFIGDMRNGRHTIRVYEVRNRIFKRDRRLVSNSSFFLKNDDVRINIGYNGQITVREFGRDNDDWGKGRDRDWDRDRDRDRDWNDHNNNRRDNRRF
jgi:hypothetical protein